jgi:hypothetical protein
MRIRFSLRMFFLLLTLVSCFFYVWLTRPSRVAGRLADAINSENYRAADALFLHAGDRFLAEWSDERWAFEATGTLRPLSLAQILTARRFVDVDIRYFDLDHTAIRQANLSATPWGIASPTISTVMYEGMLIDEARETPLRR